MVRSVVLEDELQLPGTCVARIIASKTMTSVKTMRLSAAVVCLRDKNR